VEILKQGVVVFHPLGEKHIASIAHQADEQQGDDQ
jgi:hypothetical protein